MVSRTARLHGFPLRQDREKQPSSRVIVKHMIYPQYGTTWIDWIDHNAHADMPLPTPELEAQIASAMVHGLTWRRPWHPNMATWIERAMTGCSETEEVSIFWTFLGMKLFQLQINYLLIICFRLCPCHRDNFPFIRFLLQ